MTDMVSHHHNNWQSLSSSSYQMQNMAAASTSANYYPQIVRNLQQPLQLYRPVYVDLKYLGVQNSWYRGMPLQQQSGFLSLLNKAESLKNHHPFSSDGRPMRIQWMYDGSNTRYTQRYNPYERYATNQCELRSNTDGGLIANECSNSLLSLSTETPEDIMVQENKQKVLPGIDDLNVSIQNKGTEKKKVLFECEHGALKEVNNQNKHNVSVGSDVDTYTVSEIECMPDKSGILVHSTGIATQGPLLEVEQYSLSQDINQNCNKQILAPVYSKTTEVETFSECKPLINDELVQTVTDHNISNDVQGAALFEVEDQNSQIDTAHTVGTQTQEINAENEDSILNGITVQNENNLIVPSECAVVQNAFCGNKQNDLNQICNENTTVNSDKGLKQNANKHSATYDFGKDFLQSKPDTANVDDHCAEENSNGVLFKFMHHMQEFIRKYKILLFIYFSCKLLFFIAGQLGTMCKTTTCY